MDFEVRQQQRDREQIRLEALKEKAGHVQAGTTASYEHYAAPVQETFDNVIAGSLNILRGFTLEERARRIKEHFKVADVSCSASLAWFQFVSIVSHASVLL
jgi:hypothetical protein